MIQMPAWLQAHLVEAGTMTPTGITRRAMARRCRQCGVHVMAGLDGERLATVAQVDPVPLGPLGELSTLLSGGRTFDLAWRGGRYEIDPRTDFEIEGWPPGSRPGVDVVRAHVCGAPPVDQVASAIRTASQYRLPDECPF